MSWKKANNKRRTALRGPKPRKRVPYWERIVQKGYRVDGTVFYYKDPRWPGYIEGTSYIVRHESGYVRSILIEGMGLIEGPIAGFKPMTDEEREASIASLNVLFEPPLSIEGLNQGIENEKLEKKESSSSHQFERTRAASQSRHQGRGHRPVPRVRQRSACRPADDVYPYAQGSGMTSDNNKYKEPQNVVEESKPPQASLAAKEIR